MPPTFGEASRSLAMLLDGIDLARVTALWPRYHSGDRQQIADVIQRVPNSDREAYQRTIAELTETVGSLAASLNAFRKEQAPTWCNRSSVYGVLR